MTQPAETNRRKKFIKDFGIYSIGVIGTRLITFLMVPLYTYFVEKPSDYGYYDLCLSICMLLIPLSTLQLREGAFRFLLGNDKSSHAVIVNSVAWLLAKNLVILIVFSVIAFVVFDIRYFWYCFALLFVMTVHEVIAQTCRGLGNNKVYVVSNLMNAFCIGVFSVLFVVVAGMGVSGIFISNILSRIVAISVIEAKVHIFSTLNFRSVNQDIMKEILRYCLPLIPITLCWSFTISSGRFFIKYYQGLDANGIYAVSMRFTMVLQTLSLIFYQTWQESSITQYNSPDRDTFFSKVFNNFLFLLVLLLVGFTFILKVNYFWLVNDVYSESLKYIYPLCIAAVLNALSSAYFELGYQCSKETKRAIPGIFLVFAVNIIFSFLLTPPYGIWGVTFASIISYLVLDIYRYIDTRRYFHITFNSSIILPVVVALFSAIPFYCTTAYWQDLLYLMIVLPIMIKFAPEDIQKIAKGAINKLPWQLPWFTKG